jgi:DNA-binding beta-propeller fold protein YncE
VFDSEGNFLMQIGGPGFGPGEFDEPVGLAMDAEGRLFVADTWNRRIQVFRERSDVFVYELEWPIDGWEGESTSTKPYLAISPAGEVWVTDPGNARVLVFDTAGAFRFTFGVFGTDTSSFALPCGIAVGLDGSIYITDTDNHRVMMFPGQHP